MGRNRMKCEMWKVDVRVYCSGRKPNISEVDVARMKGRQNRRYTSTVEDS